MEKRISDIVDLAAIYDWELALERDRMINLKHETDLLSVYWSTKTPLYTILYKDKSNKQKSRKMVALETLEFILQNKTLWDFKKPIPKNTVKLYNEVDSFWIDLGFENCGEYEWTKNGWTLEYLGTDVRPYCWSIRSDDNNQLLFINLRDRNDLFVLLKMIEINRQLYTYLHKGRYQEFVKKRENNK